MGFLDSLEGNMNKTARTANGALSNKSSLDYVLDFFADAGAMRGRNEAAYKLFQKAYAQDKNLALKALFYIRDVRGGQGERSLFKYIYKRLDDDVRSQLDRHVAEYGRWDDIELNESTAYLIEHQLRDDEEAMRDGRSVSLLAKWLPSINTSSTETRNKAKVIAKALNLTERKYRQKLSALRKYISLLEHKMTNREWEDINYSKIPSQAHKKHVKAFFRHDEERYKGFLDRVVKGEEKINSGTLYTYQIYDMVHKGGETTAANALWKGLPDWTNGENALVVADVSGSMYGGGSEVSPISVSVSLALYFAERNTGTFKDYFMTFSGQSSLQKVVGNTLSQKIACIERAEWGFSTNLQSAFRAILNAAIDSNASQEEIPKTLYIISDMQFNCVGSASKTNFETARDMFREHGYELPHVVFWNVNAYGDKPATKFDKNVTLISGFSQSTFQYVLAGKTPLESMLDILNSERYAPIVVE